MLGSLFAILLTPCALGQAGSRYVWPTSSRSLYFNRPVFHPESISGVWETPDGKGGAVGIALDLTTAVPNGPGRVKWMPQQWRGLEVGVFERHGSEINVGDVNFFVDSARGGVTFKQNRLEIQIPAPEKRGPSFDLDLLLQSDGCWHGRFHRGAFDRMVTLCRPKPGPHVVLSPFVGTWLGSSVLGDTCIHIAQTSHGSFVAWSDELQFPGEAKYAPGVSRRRELLEWFGSLNKVKLAGKRVIEVAFGDYVGFCGGLCQYSFVGKLSADGTLLRGIFIGPEAVTFRKMPGDSCVSSGIPGK